jgi:hypothetical protein
LTRPTPKEKSRRGAAGVKVGPGVTGTAIISPDGAS